MIFLNVNTLGLECRAARQEVELHAQRASEYAAQLKDSQIACAYAERALSEANSRINQLEDAVERDSLQMAELRQTMALMSLSKKDNGVPTEGQFEDSTKEDQDNEALRSLKQMQALAESRAAELATANREISTLQDELVKLRKDMLDQRQELDAATRLAVRMEEESKGLKAELEARDGQMGELKVLKTKMMEVLEKEGDSASSDTAKMVDLRSAEQAQQLAQNSAEKAAKLIEELAISNSKKLELESKLKESKDLLHRLKSGGEGELMKRIEALEREITVVNNRAEVNEMFRSEHERLAAELIGAKISLAESQEEMVVLKRQLVKSKEKSMTFASKLTRLETKLYRRLSRVGSKIGRSSPDPSLRRKTR